VGRARLATFILLSVLALSVPGCVTGPGFGKAAESDQPQVRRPAVTETKPAKKPQPPEEPAATETMPAKKPQFPEETEAPPKPMKPPAIGGSGG